MKKLVLLLLFSIPSMIFGQAEQLIHEKKEKPRLTQMQKYGLTGLGGAVVIVGCIWGGVKRYRYHQANKLDKDGKLPLYTVIRSFMQSKDEADKKKALKDVRKLISHGAQLNVICDTDTPLTYASGWDLTDIMAILIENGADVNFQKQNGVTALSMAAAFGHEKSAKLLIDKGADPNLGCDDGNAFFRAISIDMNIAYYMLEHAKVDVNVRNLEGDTPLLAACRYKSSHDQRMAQFKVVRKLIDLGSDINAKNNNNDTPLWIAKCHPNYNPDDPTALVKILRTRGALD